MVPATATATSAVAPTPRPTGAWPWPVVGPIIRDYDPPDSPYGSGHRGIDIAAAFGTPVRSPAPAIVKFAGKVGGQMFVTLDHGDGVETTYSWVSAILVHKNDAVFTGMPIASSGSGHPGSTVPHLHLGAKRDGAYIDPLSLLAPASVVDLVRLAPLDPVPGARAV
jgi:murein DD-endopeptidase MepM/ murein hydrolase activator NlpD